MQERRRAQRYQLAAPVRLQDGSTGITRNISTSGIFFETGRAHSIGDTFTLSVHLREASIQCEGRVVRLDEYSDEIATDSEANRHAYRSKSAVREVGA